MRTNKKLFIISGIIISLFVVGLLLPDTDLIFGILLLPIIWMIHFRNIRKGWFWILFFITGLLLNLKIENSFISIFVVSISFPSLIFAIRRTFFIRGKNVKTVKQEPEHELDTITNNPATIKNKQLLKGLINRMARRTILISIVITFLLLTLGGSMFYWYEWRPTQIKHDCSWVKVDVKAIPAQPAISVEELKARGMIKDCTIASPSPSSPSWLSKYNTNKFVSPFSCEDTNQQVINNYKDYKPEIPAKEWWRKATENEYRFCLHDKGV